jgi:hypothetical protein
MEVKIKQGNEMLDATIEMVDGVMVVSPKVELFEPENGDIVTTENGAHIFLCKDYIGEGDIYAYLGYDFNMCSWFKEGEWVAYRYATEEEKKIFFDKLKEEGWEWKPATKELVKLKCKPKEGERYYFPLYSNCYFLSYYADVIKTDNQKALYKNGWMFKTDRECIEFCNRLNDAINSVKP